MHVCLLCVGGAETRAGTVDSLGTLNSSREPKVRVNPGWVNPRHTDITIDDT